MWIIGVFSLYLALACSVYGAALALASLAQPTPAWVASARRAAWLTFPLLSLACACLVGLIVTGAFQVEYVAQVSSRTMPLYLKFTALWGGQAGSLLFWSWLLAGFILAVMLRPWRQDRALLPAVTAVTLITLAFFIGLVAFLENPFSRLWQWPGSDQITSAVFAPAGAEPFVPADGRGLNPLLRHPGMIIHPPLLYLGFVAFVIPYAFALASLVTGRSDGSWVKSTRRWTLVGWLFLSLGLMLGGRWAYDVLGWGGYWGWDPVENAALMPWLTATAFLHSAMVETRRGLFRRWNLVLVILTYGLVVFGTFLSRSGVLSSVHAFAQSAIGPWFFGFIALTFLVSLALLIYRWPALADSGGEVRWFSREGAFLLNNLLFLGVLGAILWGTLFPMISEVVTGQRVTVGPPYYNAVTGPQLAALIALMGVAPLLAWGRASLRTLGRQLLIPLGAATVLVTALAVAGMRAPGAVLGLWLVAGAAGVMLLEVVNGLRARHRSTGEGPLTALTRLFARHQQRYGGYLIHLGVCLIALGVIGSTFFQQETQQRLAIGESLTLGPYTLVYERLEEALSPNEKIVTTATVAIYRDGELLGKVEPHRDFYYLSGQPMTIAGVRSSLEDDVYVLLADWEGVAEGSATFKVYVNPLINWLWLGGVVFVLGSLVAGWPHAAAPHAAPDPNRRTLSTVASARAQRP
jgi:cytochrome c-type biogenesis protein CcmF